MTLHYRDIQYRLTRSPRRKTVSIFVERDGMVSLRVPATLSDLEVEGIIERKRRWIYERVAEWKLLNAGKVRREFRSGEGFLYLGRTYQLQFVDALDAPLKLKDGHFLLRRAREPGEGGYRRTFQEFYRDKGKVRIPQRVDFFAPRMGVAPADVQVAELQNLWASCSRNGRLSFHWKCMMAPATVLDYLVVHELAHLRHRDHSPAFWGQVDKVLPEYRDRQEWLRVNGAGMEV